MRLKELIVISKGYLKGKKYKDKMEKEIVRM